MNSHNASQELTSIRTRRRILSLLIWIQVSSFLIVAASDYFGFENSVLYFVLFIWLLSNFPGVVCWWLLMIVYFSGRGIFIHGDGYDPLSWIVSVYGIPTILSSLLTVRLLRKVCLVSRSCEENRAMEGRQASAMGKDEISGNWQ